VFAELERAPEHIHTYRITRLGLWNARAAGHTADDMLATLEKLQQVRHPAESVAVDIRPKRSNATAASVIERDEEGVLTADGDGLLQCSSEISRAKKVAELLFEKRGQRHHLRACSPGRAGNSSRNC
jgi:DNA excision repair protein ERCC-3